MIEKIHLANESLFDADGTYLKDLKNLNFIFGPNGSGKTTISRVIYDTSTYPDCAVTWAAGTPLETRVYNRDFIKKHFDAESSIRGICTFGKNVEVAATIATLKGDSNEIETKLTAARIAAERSDHDLCSPFFASRSEQLNRGVGQKSRTTSPHPRQLCTDGPGPLHTARLIGGRDHRRRTAINFAPCNKSRH